MGEREGEEKGRPWSVLGKTFSGVMWFFFLRFTTFLIVWNSLSATNKGRKTFLLPQFHLDRFRERCATARCSRTTGGDRILHSINNFRLRFHFLITQSLGRRGVRNAAGEHCSSHLAKKSPLPSSNLPHPSHFCSPLLITEIACLSLIFTLRYLTLPLSSRLS